MTTLAELKAAVARQRSGLVDQLNRAADLAERLAAYPAIVDGVEIISDVERKQLKRAAAAFKAARSMLIPIRLESLVPPIKDDTTHEPIT